MSNKHVLVEENESDSNDSIDELNVNDLKKVLKIFYLATNGTKQQLRDRLRVYFNSINVNSPSAQTYVFSSIKNQTYPTKGLKSESSNTSIVQSSPDNHTYSNSNNATKKLKIDSGNSSLGQSSLNSDTYTDQESDTDSSSTTDLSDTDSLKSIDSSLKLKITTARSGFTCSKSFKLIKKYKTLDEARKYVKNKGFKSGDIYDYDDVKIENYNCKHKNFCGFYLSIHSEKSKSVTISAPSLFEKKHNQNCTKKRKVIKKKVLAI